MEKIINLDINDRAFKAINEGTKKVEIRVSINKIKKDYGVIKPDDIIVFSNSKNEKLECKVIENIWYKINKFISKSTTTKELIKIFNSIYPLEKQEKYGVLGISFIII